MTLKELALLGFWRNVCKSLSIALNWFFTHANIVVVDLPRKDNSEADELGGQAIIMRTTREFLFDSAMRQLEEDLSRFDDVALVLNIDGGYESSAAAPGGGYVSWCWHSSRRCSFVVATGSLFRGGLESYWAEVLSLEGIGSTLILSERPGERTL